MVGEGAGLAARREERGRRRVARKRGGCMGGVWGKGGGVGDW
jgi:hypothetical protein